MNGDLRMVEDGADDFGVAFERDALVFLAVVVVVVVEPNGEALAL